MIPEEYERQDIEGLNDVTPYCFKSDREEQGFKVELQYRLDTANKEPLIHWISVKDDLPCNHKELINPKDITETIPVLANIGGVIGITKMVKNNYTGEWIWATQVTVHHWMPIPELPKE